MACAHPLHIRPNYKMSSSDGTWLYPSLYEYDVPCGYCVNCRADKINYIVDRANFEYCQRLSASFVTFTYDDVHLIDDCAVRSPEGGFMYDTNSNGDRYIRTTLCYKDIQGFIDRIRHYIKSHPELHNILCQPDFSYMYVGEYGGLFQRCHFHILFFGLDFAYCKKIIFEQWDKGFIDVLPLLDGGIRYVCKYMDKMEYGLQAELKYDFRGMARPKLKMSKGFGQGLLWKNAKDIIDHDYTYECAHKKRRPISTYWKVLLTGNCTSRDVTKKSTFEKTDEYIRKQKERVAYDLKSLNFHRQGFDIYDDDVQSAFRLRQSRIREYNLTVALRNKQTPVQDWTIQFSKNGFKEYVTGGLIHSRFGNVTFDHDEIRKCSDKVKRALQSFYLEDLHDSLPSCYFA